MTASAQTLQNSSSKKVYLSLGSNLGDRGGNMDAAELLIEQRVGKICSKSSRMENAPVGFVSQNSFINEVIEVDTALSPTDVLEATEGIETELGRKSKSRSGIYADRTMDIDIIYYGNEVYSSDRLTIPHPRMADRLFVLSPLNEIAPLLEHPVLHATTTQLLSRVS